MGVEAIFIERALDTQKGIDDLIAGSLTPEEFATQYDGGKLWDREGAEEARMRVAEGIIYAASRGIKLLSANIFTKGIASPEERAEIYGFFGGMSAAFEKECPGAQFMTQEFNEKYWIENISRLKITPERFEEIMGERSNDSGRVAFIKEAAGGKRSVILFGNGHFTGAPKSIKTLLGTENVVHISMFPETAKLTHYDSGNNKADFLFLTGEQRIYKVGDIPFSGSGAAKKPGAPTP
ncbi:MAG: hypothetical protein HY370_06915 [Proteobacteria bacterium]|nr:hypothetical protein [Pseudomonadota bacterium]